MSCPPAQSNFGIILEDIFEGNTWGGLLVQFTSNGVALNDPLASVTMVFKDSSGNVGLSLSSGSGITITDANAWSFIVHQITTFPLAVGVWSWAIIGTNTSGSTLTRLTGIKRVKA